VYLQLSAQVKTSQLLVSSEFGYRFLDGEKVKIDALMGVRYWHLPLSVQFSPSVPGLNFSGSQNWADPLMGARIQFPLSPKLLVTILGDAGGWGAGSELDYQIVGAVGYKLNPKFRLDVGYRYLFVNYHPGDFLYKAAMSGAVVGVSYTLK
jgi:outer membrane receptor protein involved in Fe transport